MYYFSNYLFAFDVKELHHVCQMSSTKSWYGRWNIVVGGDDDVGGWVRVLGNYSGKFAPSVWH